MEERNREANVACLEVTLSKDFRAWIQEFRMITEKLDDLVSRIPESVLETAAAVGQEEKPSEG